MDCGDTQLARFARGCVASLACGVIGYCVGDTIGVIGGAVVGFLIGIRPLGGA